MAKKSVVARDQHKEQVVHRCASKVADLKDRMRKASGEERYDLQTQLSRLPRNASKCRLTRRCQRCGRPKGVYRAFGLCRICVRNAAMRGDIPGLVKASW